MITLSTSAKTKNQLILDAVRLKESIQQKEFVLFLIQSRLLFHGVPARTIMIMELPIHDVTECKSTETTNIPGETSKFDFTQAQLDLHIK